MVPLRRNRDFLVLMLFSAWQVVFAAAALSARSLRNAQPIVAPAHAS